MDIQKLKVKLIENIDLKIVSLILAIALWFYAVGQQKAEIIFNVPIEIDAKENMTVYGQSHEFLTITLRSQQNIIRGLSKSQLRVILNLSEYKQGNISYEITSKNITCPEEIEIVDFTPKKFTAKQDFLSSKFIPVKVITEGNLDKNYFIESISADPKIVRIEGAKGKIDKIKFIETQPIGINGAKFSFTNIIRLYSKNDWVIIKDPQEIKVAVNVFKEKYLTDIPITIINHPTLKSSINPLFLQAILYSDIYTIDSLDPKTIHAKINASKLKKGEYIIKDKNIEISTPANIKIKKIVTSEIKLKIF